jgi:hypothetical protein
MQSDRRLSVLLWISSSSNKPLVSQSDLLTDHTPWYIYSIHIFCQYSFSPQFLSGWGISKKAVTQSNSQQCRNTDYCRHAVPLQMGAQLIGWQVWVRFINHHAGPIGAHLSGPILMKARNCLIHPMIPPQSTFHMESYKKEKYLSS